MTLKELLVQGRAIWGETRLTLPEILIRLGVVFGDLCRVARGADKDLPQQTREELEKELGNIIASTVRWCDDLGFDPEVCVARAFTAQNAFKMHNRKT